MVVGLQERLEVEWDADHLGIPFPDRLGRLKVSRVTGCHLSIATPMPFAGKMSVLEPSPFAPKQLLYFQERIA
jgi:hypothetical protein